MADLDVSPWVFTSADVSTDPITRDRLRISSVRWTGATSAAHAVKLKDLDGNTIVEMTSTAADYTEETALSLPSLADMNGLVIDTLESGTLYVYIA